MSTYNFTGASSQGTTKTISVTSGKGGVGKTSIVANMALQLASQGKKVLILDGDWGMANIDIMFGVNNRFNINDVLCGRKQIQDVVFELHPGVDLIPGGQGVYELSQVSSFERRFLLDQISSLEGIYDVMLIDTAPGISDNVLYLNSAAQEICVVVSSDPSSLADTYSLIKVLNKRYRETNFSILCNQVKDGAEGIKVFSRLEDVAAQFLCVNLRYLGCIPFDPELRAATKSQQLVTISRPMSISSRSVAEISKKLCGYRQLKEQKGGMQFFWEQVVGVA